MDLTGKQIRYLRGLGHHLKPVVMIGKEELTVSLIAAVDETLQIHELIKVKLQEGCIGDRKDIAAELAQETQSNIVQVLGRNILLYRPSEDKKISLP
ncbi:MAG: ribosome assembly RNA-binding protein YhbY [Desulfuromonadales bacterium]|nr:ribosome assembly RNA-binding protein YhbY [Desulfuromonadales bacterium]MBN2793725.1 ribosome assembly RNA-binding protein YhbY [Desulfuromonadales bacterium]